MFHRLSGKCPKKGRSHFHGQAGTTPTGLLYVDPRATDLHEGLETVETPLNQLTDAQLIPGSAVLAKLNASLR